jgi:hypothetical protein
MSIKAILNRWDGFTCQTYGHAEKSMPMKCIYCALVVLRDALDDDRADLLAKIGHLGEALEAVLMFHGTQIWGDAEKERWRQLTQADEATTKTLCTAVRAAREDLPVVKSYREAAAMAQRNAEFYRGILEEIGAEFGDEAKTADDGTLAADIFVSKLPALVRGRARAPKPEPPKPALELDAPGEIET